MIKLENPFRVPHSYHDISPQFRFSSLGVIHWQTLTGFNALIVSPFSIKMTKNGAYQALYYLNPDSYHGSRDYSPFPR
jgi:hypothetical protein